jgi:hypothetical protein
VQWEIDREIPQSYERQHANGLHGKQLKAGDITRIKAWSINDRNFASTVFNIVSNN